MIIQDYSFNVTTATLTIIAGQPVEFPQIKNIHNLSKKRPVYNSENNTINNLSSFTITDTGATCVLTCPYVSQFSNGDIFQIEIDERIGTGAAAYAELEFLDTDNLTTEIVTSAIPLQIKSKTNEYMVCVSKPNEATAGDMTIYLYNQVKVDGINIVDVLTSILTVEQIASTVTNRAYLVTGLGIGEGTIKIGGKFTTDSGAITVNAVVYPL